MSYSLHCIAHFLKKRLILVVFTHVKVILRVAQPSKPYIIANTPTQLTCSGVVSILHVTSRIES